MSIHLYNAEKKDVKIVCDLMNEFKEVDLQELNYPEVDHNKLNTLHHLARNPQNHFQQ